MSCPDNQYVLYDESKYMEYDRCRYRQVYYPETRIWLCCWNEDSEDGLGLAIGIGVCVFYVLLFILICFLCKKQRKQRKSKTRVVTDIENVSPGIIVPPRGTPPPLPPRQHRPQGTPPPLPQRPHRPQGTPPPLPPRPPVDAL